MLRNCVCLVFAHMLDATPVMGWGGVGMLTFLELAHMLDATQLCLSCLRTHAGCDALCLRTRSLKSMCDRLFILLVS